MKNLSLETALTLFEEEGNKLEAASGKGDSKKMNRVYSNLNTIAGYLRQYDSLSLLNTFLDHSNLDIRYHAAFYLLWVDERKAKKVLKEIAALNSSFASLDAKYTLIRWDQGEITWPTH